MGDHSQTLMNEMDPYSESCLMGTDVNGAIERFIENVHSKNPILEIQPLREAANDCHLNGFRKDAMSAMVVSTASYRKRRKDINTDKGYRLCAWQSCKLLYCFLDRVSESASAKRTRYRHTDYSCFLCESPRHYERAAFLPFDNSVSFFLWCV
jgi:hypothetical protein